MINREVKYFGEHWRRVQKTHTPASKIYIWKLLPNFHLTMLRRQVRQLSASARLLAANSKVLYLKALLLPKTAFSPKIPTDQARKNLIEKSGKSLYLWQQKRPDYEKEFVLHDGPPYANGDLHLGHSLNKILKDIINRFELLHNDLKVSYRPGWDCHGLPIEMKAIQDAGRLSAPETRKLCRELASFMIDKQRQQFLDFGIMADFDTPYVTMASDYEAAQLQIFLKLFENGLLSRQLKPVWWGCETQTALAEAELEYNANHKSIAIYVKFPLTNSELLDRLGGNVHLLIWTSTPWTIPANKAICVNSQLDYMVLENVETGEKLIVGVERADEIIKLDSSYSKTDIVIKGSELEGLHYENPSFQDNTTYPVLHGDHVTASAGTGLVHNAPGHGLEDFLVGQKHKLNGVSSVDARGLYIENNLPLGFLELAGKYANGKASMLRCLEILESHKMLFHVNKKFTHSYPYDWRSKTPVIQRATPQWFVNVEDIKEAATKLLEQVEFIPEAGRNRLTLFVNNRSEWCISRQRTWGVPLPIVYSKETHEPLDDLDTIRHVVNKLAEFGTDQWFEEEEDISRWLPEDRNGRHYYKGKDTMDVWFDSGTSWSTLGDNLTSLMSSDTPLADVYLEGSDQHRGWFQSSLINKIIASGVNKDFKPVAPYKKIITHGFTLDKKMDKMSKSKGNVILPLQVIEGGGKPAVPALGTDGLRLWVASSNYTLDVSVSPEVLTRVMENVKKLRVTFKYMLGNLHDFEDAVPLSQLNPLDKWLLSRLHTLQEKTVEAYRSHNYAKVVRELNAHMSGDLSALYFDISKDCLYTSGQNSPRRRGIQTVLDYLVRVYIGILAPIQPVLTQEVWDVYAAKFNHREDSPFKMKWSYFTLPEEVVDTEIASEFDTIWKIRDSLYKSLETLRGEGLFKNKLEAEVYLDTESESLNELLEKHKEFLDDYFLVSRVTLGPPPVAGPQSGTFSVQLDEGSVNATITHSRSCKCPRCWKYISESEDILCGKCAEVTP